MVLLKIIYLYSREDKVNIVIDATDWGHSVGEIEIMVMDHDHITEATSKIETIGAELGKIVVFDNLNWNQVLVS